LNYPWWGAANTPYKRLLPHDYDDGVNSMKEKSVVHKYFLPNSRTVAITLHREHPTKSVWTNFMTSFGQSIAHELALTYVPKLPDGSDMQCECNTVHENCFNIEIPEADVFYRKNYKTCYPFTRDQASVRDYECNYGPREQLNRYSHYLDLSYLYSNSYHSRKRVGGQLRFSVNANGEITFPLKNPNGCPYARGSIYHTGDVNGEQNVYLTAAQTIWLRNHNQVADGLQKINPHWDDETLFQQARRINIAMYQHVVYNEYLPQLLGPSTTKIYDIEPLTWGYYDKYNPNLYPQLLNEFSAAAFRLHFLVNNHQCWADDKYRLFDCHELSRSTKNSSHSCWSLDEVIRGQIAQPSYYATPQLSWVMNNWLLNEPKSIGLLNIQRGRDHGLKGYNFYRELCGLNRARSFDELYNIPPSVRNQLKSLYYHVDDIDLWSGGVSELPIRDGFIGHTFTCNFKNNIIAKNY
jgi:peroxidase